MTGCNVECGARGVVPGEMPGPGSLSPHEVPRAHSRRGSRDETPLSRRNLGRHLQTHRLGGGHEVFDVGTRVVLTRPRDVFDLLRFWTVIECACDLCDRGRVALNEWTGHGWRHELRSTLRVYGHVPANDFTAP